MKEYQPGGMVTPLGIGLLCLGIIVGGFMNRAGEPFCEKCRKWF